MRWTTLDDLGETLEDFLDKQDEVKNLKAVEFTFDCDNPTGVLIELKDGSLIFVGSTETDDDGNRNPLYVGREKKEGD